MAVETLGPKIYDSANPLTLVTGCVHVLREKVQVRKQEALHQTRIRENLNIYLEQEASKMMKGSVCLNPELGANPIGVLMFHLNFGICKLKAVVNGTYHRILSGELQLERYTKTDTNGKTWQRVKVIEAPERAEITPIRGLKHRLAGVVGEYFADRTLEKNRAFVAGTIDRASTELQETIANAFTEEEFGVLSRALLEEGVGMTEAMEQMQCAVSEILTSKEMKALNCILVELRVEEIANLSSEDLTMNAAIVNLMEVFQGIVKAVGPENEQLQGLMARNLTQAYLLEIAHEYAFLQLETVQAIENEELVTLALSRLQELGDCGRILDSQTTDSLLAAFETSLATLGGDTSSQEQMLEAMSEMMHRLEDLLVYVSGGTPLAHLAHDILWPGSESHHDHNRLQNTQQRLQDSLLLDPVVTLRHLPPHRIAEWINTMTISPTDSLIKRTLKTPFVFLNGLNIETWFRLGFVSAGELTLNVTLGLIEACLLFRLYKAWLPSLGVDLGPLEELDLQLSHFLVGGVLTKLTFSSCKYLNPGNLIKNLPVIGSMAGLAGLEVKVTEPAKAIQSEAYAAEDNHQPTELVLILDQREYAYLRSKNIIPAQHQAFNIPNLDPYGNLASKVILPVARYKEKMFPQAQWGTLAGSRFVTSGGKEIALTSRWEAHDIENRVNTNSNLSGFIRDWKHDDGGRSHKIVLPAPREDGQLVNKKFTLSIFLRWDDPQLVYKGTFELDPNQRQKAAGIKRRTDLGGLKWLPLVSMLPTSIYALGKWGFTGEFPVWTVPTLGVLALAQIALSKALQGIYPGSHYGLIDGDFAGGNVAAVPYNRHAKEVDTGSAIGRETLKYVFDQIIDIMDLNAIVAHYIVGYGLYFAGGSGNTVFHDVTKYVGESVIAFNSLFPMLLRIVGHIGKERLGIQGGGADVSLPTPTPSVQATQFGGDVLDINPDHPVWAVDFFKVLQRTYGEKIPLGIHTAADMGKTFIVLPHDNPDIAKVCQDGATTLAGCAEIARPAGY